MQAGQTFVTLALYHAKLGNKHDAATNYVDAANCFKKSDPKGKSSGSQPPLRGPQVLPIIYSLYSSGLNNKHLNSEPIQIPNIFKFRFGMVGIIRKHNY